MTDHPTTAAATPADPAPPSPDDGRPPHDAGAASTSPAAGRTASADAQRARSALLAVRAEVAKAVVGQDAAVAGLLVGAALPRPRPARGRARAWPRRCSCAALAAALDLETKRVQFTPDLMPGDVTGSLVFDARTSDFTFRQGPVFTNLLLADEINRTPPKTQSALLEAMEERQVSVDGQPHPLPSPFMVAATQNPVEYEGTYPLPEAQLDRFLLKVVLPLPQRDDEVQVLRRHASGLRPARPRRGRHPTRRHRRRPRRRRRSGARGGDLATRSRPTSSTSPGPPGRHPRSRSASHLAEPPP